MVWLLPNAGEPKLLLRAVGALRRFQPIGAGVTGVPGIWIDRETYDGVHAETRGRKLEFWLWDEHSKKLRLTP
jgi:hypothetical protein